MKIIGLFIMGWTLGLASHVAYGEESADVKKHEKKLAILQTTRALDNKHTVQAQEEFRKGTAEMSGHAEQQMRDVQDLRVIESKVTAGEKQNSLAHQAYKDTVQSYGSNDPRASEAQQTWKQGQQAMNPLLQSRQTLKKDIHQGDRRVHNEKTVLSLKKRTLDSEARYRAIDDRKIKKEEKTIANERNAMPLVVRTP